MNGTNSSTHKISLYTRRKIGEKINAALDFLRQNWRTALRFSIYLLLPVALIHSVGVFTIFKSTFANKINTIDLSVIMSFKFMVISVCIIYALILTLFQYYQGSDDGDLSMLTFRDVRGQLWSNFKRVATLAIPVMITVVVAFFVSMIIIFVPFLSLFALLAIATLVFIMMMAPIFYVMEDVTAGAAFNRAFSHAKTSWGGLLGLMLSMFLVVLVIQSITAMPMLVFAFAYNNLTLAPEQTGYGWSIAWDAIVYIFTIAQTFFSYLSIALVVTTMVFHYGSEASVQDDVGIANDIENFANL